MVRTEFPYHTLAAGPSPLPNSWRRLVRQTQQLFGLHLQETSVNQGPLGQISLEECRITGVGRFALFSQYPGEDHGPVANQFLSL